MLGALSHSIPIGSSSELWRCRSSQAIWPDPPSLAPPASCPLPPLLPLLLLLLLGGQHGRDVPPGHEGQQLGLADAARIQLLQQGLQGDSAGRRRGGARGGDAAATA